MRKIFNNMRITTDTLNAITFIAVIEINIIMLAIIFGDDYSAWNLGHMIIWSVWLIILLAYRLLKKL